jgi:hypothetical protein
MNSDDTTIVGGARNKNAREKDNEDFELNLEDFSKSQVDDR